jgi:hypothetical protein
MRTLPDMPSYVHHSSQLTPEIPAREIAVLSLSSPCKWAAHIGASSLDNLFVDPHAETLSRELQFISTSNLQMVVSGLLPVRTFTLEYRAEVTL